MKLDDSVFKRREFLNWLTGGWLAALFGSLVSPIVRFVLPPYQEPDKVTLPIKDYEDMAPGAITPFAWGAKPGFIKKEGGGFVAIVGVCTHLDCNVAWQPKERKFFCACHSGWYDAEGKNIAGPPPHPLRRLRAEVEGETLVVKKEGVA